MHGWNRIRLLGALAVAALVAGVLTGVYSPAPRHGPAASQADDGSDAPLPHLNDGHLSSPAQVSQARQQAASIPSGDAKTWQFVGPTNVGGRVVDLAVDPSTSPSTVYAAVSSGGIMKSTDGGTTWSPAWPGSGTQAMGALARGPDGTLWAGTGEANPSGGGDTFLGDGIYKSTDGGQSWQQWGLPDGGAFGRIAVNPRNPSEVWAAASGWISPISSQRGLYRLTNGGKDWKLALAPPNDTTGAIDVAVDPANPNIILASLWDRYRNNGAFHYGGTGSGLYRSTDGGNTWHNSNGLHADHHAMAWDPNAPNLIYEGDDGGVYVSTQNGASGTWTHARVEPWNQSYHLSVSQQDPLRMVTGLQDQGSIRTWTPGVEPTDLTQWNAYGGGDGHWVQINPDNELAYYECLQPAPPTVNCARFADSAATGPAVTTRTNFSSPAWPSGTRITTDTPLVLDPADPNYVYIGGTSIARSGDGVVSGSGAWTLISPATPDSPDSLPGPVPPSEVNPDTYYANEYGAVTEIAPAKSTGTATSPATTIYAGTDTGKLWKTTNATATPASDVSWTQLGAGVLPQRWVTSIVVDPTDASHVFVSFSNYKEGDLAANVWETTDGGATWRNISGNMPNAPVWMVTYDQPRNQLYASTDFGVFYLKNGNKNWARLGSGLPNCPVLDVKLSGDGNTLYAATFGRGIYKMPVP